MVERMPSDEIFSDWPTRPADIRYSRVVNADSGEGGLAPNWSRLDALGLYLNPPR